MVITFIAVFFPMFVCSSRFGMNRNVYQIQPPPPCLDPCRMTLVESIPENLTYAAGSPQHLSTYEGWMNLLGLANKTIHIASLYWSLRGSDLVPDPSAWQGETIYKELLRAGRDRGISIKIAQSMPNELSPNQDTIDLERAGAAEVRSLNFTYLMGGGVLHTKIWIIDDLHVYVGSANMDWRSLTQVKELGVVMYNCSCLAQDIRKIFNVYWYLGHENATLPTKWPAKYKTQYNNVHPFNITLNTTNSLLYFSSSPAPFCPSGRTVDIDSILDVIHNAQHFIHVAVMDYFPITLYTAKTIYWPVIDDALRVAAIERGVRIRLMASWWNHTRPDLIHYLASLSALNRAHHADIQVKLFHVPTYPAQAHIPFARVNHNKYMVTDNAAYIGTSNWSGDYFINTGGVGVVINQTHSNPTLGTNTLYQQVVDVFERDWNSNYTRSLTRLVRHSKRLKNLLNFNEGATKRSQSNEL